MATKRENFSDRDKAQLYANGLAICAFCGTDLWHLRRGIDPYAEHDWADHVRPSARGGGKLIENGITACSACNVKKGDNTRDRGYFFENGRPTPEYLLRFDRMNPLVATTLRANAQVHWTDWYFNRALCHLTTTVNEVWRLQRDLPPRKRTPTYWAGAAMKRAREWKRFRVREGLAPPAARGLVPAALEADQALMLELFDADTTEDAVALAERLVPYQAGHVLVHDLKVVSLDPAAAEAIAQALGDGAIDALFGANPALSELHLRAIAHGIAVAAGDRYVPAHLSEWPPLSPARLALFTDRKVLAHA